MTNTYLFAKITKDFKLVASWFESFDCDAALDAHIAELQAENPGYLIKCDEYETIDDALDA